MANWSTTIILVAFSFYIYLLASQIYSIVNPDLEFTATDAPVRPFWKKSQKITISCYISESPKWHSKDFHNPKVRFLGEWANIAFDWSNPPQTSLRLPLHANDSTAEDQNHVSFWNHIRQNGTYYLHAHITHAKASADPQDRQRYHPDKTVHQSTPLVKYGSRRNLKNATLLLAEYSEFFRREVKCSSDPLNQTYATPDLALTASVVSFWKPEITISLVTDFTVYPSRHIPPLVYRSLQIVRSRDRELYYKPVLYVDESALTTDKLIPLNHSTNYLPMELRYHPISYGHWQLLLLFEQTLRSQREMGLEETDLDDLKHLITNTSPILLLVTLIVSLLHILFDVLAFQNDIAFWRSSTSKAGISSTTLVSDAICQLVVLLYLVHERTNILILGSHCAGFVIQVWKIGITLRLQLNRPTSSSYYLPTLTLSTSDQEKNTSTNLTIDNQAMVYLQYLFTPLLLGYSLYSLIYLEHASWYGWVLKSLTGVVYTFGFILMTPQLVMNYKLKSVAHLPWKVLIYKAMNTFIDDLFAFIIHMPMMHRLSCFRDDIIFFIYLYQRWIYPVDQTRKEGEESKEATAKEHQE